MPVDLSDSRKSMPNSRMAIEKSRHPDAFQRAGLVCWRRMPSNESVPTGHTPGTPTLFASVIPMHCSKLFTPQLPHFRARQATMAKWRL
jgi:hypothetical protein